MSDVKLTNVSPALLKEWSEYALQSGLPLEYLILEAVTYSVRSDRLGIEAARLICVQRQKTLVLAKRNAQTNSAKQQETVNNSTLVIPESFEESSNSSSHTGQVVHNLPTEYMDSNESSAALEDYVPRNL